MLFGFLFRMPSIERLERWIKDGVFNRLLKGKRLPSGDVIRNSFKDADPSQLQEINDQVIQKARRNKVLRDGTIDGWVVSALDGVELFESKKKCCPGCLTRVIDGVTHHYHRFVGCCTVGQNPRILWDMEPLKPRDGERKDEGEITGAKRLVESLYHRFHHFTDILVCDALYAKSTFINSVSEFNIDLVIRMKDERLLIMKDARGLFSKRKPDHEWTTRQKNQYIKIEAWEEQEMEMTGVPDGIRFVRFMETIQKKLHGKVVSEEKKEIMIITTCKQDVPVNSLWKMIHKRWDIENCIFHHLKTHWNMGHCFIHDEKAIPNCINVLCIAYNLWNLFLFRHLRMYDPKKYPQVYVAERMRFECEFSPEIPILLAAPG